ncbi:hypothetical protein ES703_108865 [subsurface metagenome]
MKWIVKLSKYKRQVKVSIPGELSRLAGLHRSEYVKMDLDSKGKIIMEGFGERGNGKFKGGNDQVGVN